MIKLVNMRFTTALIGSCVLTMVVPNIGWARSDLDVRVERLENIVANELNIKLINQLEAVQQEVRELRGKLEEQQNSVQVLSQRQEKLFLNLDSRLNGLHSSAVPTAADTPASVVVVPPVTQQSEPVAVKESAPTQQLPELEVGTSEKALYDAANTMLHEKKYTDAILEFKDLLWQFPEGTYAIHAQYWLGELYMMQWQRNRADTSALSQAKEAFNTVNNKYQGHERAGDALLKLGLLEMDLDHLALAKDLLLQVVSKYPNTARARIAESNILRIDQTHFAQIPAQ